MMCYLDDNLMTGATREGHLCHWEQVLQRLQTHGLCFKRSKCKFLEAQVNYFRLVVNAEGVQDSNDKIEAVLEAPQPYNINELCSFPGMMNYYHKFIPILAMILKPLTNLLQFKVRWH